jgi:hypothetical protein
MSLTAERVEAEALSLPVSGRAHLVEKLLASLSGEVNPDVEKVHLEVIQERRALVKRGESRLLDGPAALKQLRAASHQ